MAGPMCAALPFVKVGKGLAGASCLAVGTHAVENAGANGARVAIDGGRKSAHPLRNGGEDQLRP